MSSGLMESRLLFRAKIRKTVTSAIRAASFAIRIPQRRLPPPHRFPTKWAASGAASPPGLRRRLINGTPEHDYPDDRSEDRDSIADEDGGNSPTFLVLLMMAQHKIGTGSARRAAARFCPWGACVPMGRSPDALPRDCIIVSKPFRGIIELQTNRRGGTCALSSAPHAVGPQCKKDAGSYGRKAL